MLGDLENAIRSRNRAFCCATLLLSAFCHIVSGAFTPVLAKHTKSFNLVDTLSVGVDRIQRNFEPLQRQVELWRKTQISDDTAKLIFYSAFIDGKLEAPRTLLPEVHRLYFEPQYPEFAAGRCGASRTHLPARSRSSILCRSSKRRPSWEAFSLNCLTDS